ncbi:MAG: GNAT family N-acetyltransferase, partial [Candidatus Eisenbacteria bacterium]|nr:GNAT family N-acetyltransferase [Candidatus Eisenbacteria bacterium]
MASTPAGKGPIRVRRIAERDREAVKRILFRRWGPPGVVSRGRLHAAHEHAGFLAEEGARIVGLVTYETRRGRCEVVSLDALRRGGGIGTRLLAAVERRARSLDCREVWLITTNDNLRALRFYQRRGYEIRAVHSGSL